MRPTLLLAAAVLAATAGVASAAPDRAPPVVARPADPCAGPAPDRMADPLDRLPFGCANAINLRLMVADPRDLDRGASPAGPTGDAALAAVQRHRAGQVKSLSRAAASATTEGP
jgi:type IV pilus biogenesis protein CpaD/CtpE